MRHMTHSESFLVSACAAATDELWIGLNDRRTERLFDWSDHSTVTFTSWEYGSPTLNADQNDCVLMRGEVRSSTKAWHRPYIFLTCFIHNSVLRGTARVYPSARRVKAEGTPWTSCQTTLTLTLVFHQLELTGRLLTTPHLTPKHNKESPVDFDACIWTVGGGNPCAYIENSIQKLPGPGKWLATWERQQH